DAQQRVELQVTGGRTLITLGIKGILPFLAPAWVAVLAVPFDLLGTNVGGRLWILFGLACLALGAYLAVRPRPPSEMLPVFASVPTALMMLNAQLDGMVALGLGGALALWSRPYFAGLALGTLFPAGLQTIAVAVLTLAAVAAVVVLAWRSRQDFHATAALLVGGGVLAAPHALPADLVLVGLALAIWGKARWKDWLLLSAGAAIAAFVPAPWPTIAGVLLVAYLVWRISAWRPARAAASAG